LTTTKATPTGSCCAQTILMRRVTRAFTLASASSAAVVGPVVRPSSVPLKDHSQPKDVRVSEKNALLYMMQSISLRFGK
jgi:hypothetical protein